ncbi:MAG: von Willebrand factor type A domain-containing protein [Chitinophagaceae bacterium]|nr:von Willebrand factor type A domain-containing protein [Chitinophagaceae bacterium]
MRNFILATLTLTLALNSSAQYYIRGDVKDEKNQPLQNVKIYMHSNHLLYYSGVTGGFGIPSPLVYDSLTFSTDGFEPRSVKVKTNVYQEIVLKVLNNRNNLQKQRVVSFTKDLDLQAKKNWLFGNESYSNLIENDFIKAAKYPSTTFTLRTDKASYSNVRRFINQKSIVPPDAVRIEEMLNYFNLNYKAPKKDEVFSIESQLTACPWNNAHELLFLNIDADKLNLDKVPPSNLVFLIDVSGSMDLPNRLPLLKAGFAMLVKNLRAIDTVSIVVYGGTVGVWLQPTSGAEKQKIIKSIEELNASGDTPGEAAIRSAYKLAKSTFIKNGNNRIILATDGDFNVGQTTEKELDDLITLERQTGIYLTCLGVGMGNYKDSKIETLAKKGNGNFAYLDDVREAEKVLVTEFTQTLYTIANDVYASVKFNPVMVKEYRLIGYDNKRDVLDDSTTQIEGGEIGSGNGITVVFEITPTEDNLFSNAPLLKDDIATLTLHYKLPDKNTEHQITKICPMNFLDFKEINNDLKFASAVTMFGLVLRDSKYISGVSWDDILSIARETITPGDYLQNEFISLAEQAKKIYKKTKKRKEEK